MSPGIPATMPRLSAGSTGTDRPDRPIFTAWCAMELWKERCTIGRYQSREYLVSQPLQQQKKLEIFIIFIPLLSTTLTSSFSLSPSISLPVSLSISSLTPSLPLTSFSLDRVVDELAPERHLSLSDFTSLLAPLVHTVTRRA